MHASHLLPLSTLHAAAPGILDVVFGPDGDFEGAPKFRGPLRSCNEWVVLDFLDEHGAFVRSPEWVRLYRGRYDVALDLRVHAIYVRLLRLCSFVQVVDVDLTPEDLAALTLALAPQIAAL